tara:strand:+ start:170 stop:625 length:456 start_codon:yes stop_codon:yes gene_type:complete
MARFVQQKDLAFFEKISKELVDVVVQTTVEIFKLSISESRTNLYGESLGKSYHPSVQVACLIEREESSIEYEGFGPDRAQNVEFRFNRFTLEEANLYPEIGDIIFHNNAYFEIDKTGENQMIYGRPEEKFSIICSAFMVRRTQLNIESRIV